MSLQHLRKAAAANRNPINCKALPKTRPTLEFPIVTETRGQEIWNALSIMAVMMCGCVVTPVVCVFCAGNMVVIPFVLALFVLAYSDHLLRVKYAERIFAFFAVVVISLFLLWCHPFGLFFAFNLILLLEPISFRRHYINRASAGMLDVKTVEQFRKYHRIPRSLTPRSTLLGFADAVVSYLTYNSHGVRAPGALLSPAGPHWLRVTRTFITLTGLTYGATLLPQLPFQILSIEDELPLGGWTFIVPPLAAGAMWLTGTFLATFTFVGKAYALKSKQIAPEHWQRLIDRIRNSPDPTERNSIFLSFVAYDRSPILYLVSKLFQHAWIVGKTGSGKTAYLMFLIDQLIRRGDVSIVFIDLKAHSFEVFATMLNASRAVARFLGFAPTVKHFTLADKHATFIFDIFSQAWWKNLPAPQRTGVILSTLSLVYSRAYGQSWFADANYDFLLFVLTRHPNVASWTELEQHLIDAIRYAKPWELTDQVREHGQHVYLIVKRLAALPALHNDSSHSTAARTAAIDFAEAFKSPQHYYFALDPGQNGLIAGEVARLVASALLCAARDTKRKKNKIIIFIDEFQEAVTKDLQLLLTQARGLGVGVVLANQTSSQLVTPDCDLRPIVEGNSSLQAWMQITDDIGADQMSRLGGTRIDKLVSRHTSSQKSEVSYTYTEHIVDRVDRTLIANIGSDKRQFLLRITDNDGYACYDGLMFAAYAMYHQNENAYRVCCAMPWPAPSAQTIVNSSKPRPTLPPPFPPSAATTKPSKHVPNPLGRKRKPKRHPTNP